MTKNHFYTFFLVIFQLSSCNQPVQESSPEEIEEVAARDTSSSARTEQVNDTASVRAEDITAEVIFSEVFHRQAEAVHYGGLVSVGGKTTSLITAEESGGFPEFSYDTTRSILYMGEQSFEVENPLNVEETRVYGINFKGKDYLILEGPGKETNRERSRIRHFELYEYTDQSDIKNYSLQSNFGSVANFGDINRDEQLDFVQLIYHPDPELYGSAPEVHILNYYSLNAGEAESLSPGDHAVLRYLPYNGYFEVIENDNFFQLSPQASVN